MRLSTEERRAQLLAVGLRQFGARAYGDVSIDDIAAEAGVAKGLLYHYFGGKKELYRASLQVAADAMVEAIASDPALPGPLRVAQGLAAYLAFVDERAAAFAALTDGGLGQDPEVAEVIERTRARLAEQILVAVGLAPPWPAAFRLVVRAWLGGVEAASRDWLRARDLPRDQLIPLLAPALRAGLEAAIAADPSAGVHL
jgi:AcrR family transcriptional regulator